MTETYPGSSQPLRSAQRRVDALKGSHGWDARPVRLEFKGQMTEFFTIGALAQALQRENSTLRDWETMGYLPRAPRRTGSNAPTRHGKRRLYLREEVEGLMKLADEEGLFKRGPGGQLSTRVADTGFPQRAQALFDAIKEDRARADQ